MGDNKVYGVGVYKKGKYLSHGIDGKVTKCYHAWYDMLKRCYDKKWKKNRPTYNSCTVCEEWWDFQTFAEWWHKHYYEIDGEEMCIDKDILVKGNKLYSPSTCVLVPKSINVLFVKGNKRRGGLPIGVSERKGLKGNSYIVSVRGVHLGTYKTSHEAFLMDKINKEMIIQSIAEEYKPYIPSRLYEAMMNYEVEEND